MKVLPWPGTPVTLMSPPWARATAKVKSRVEPGPWRSLDIFTEKKAWGAFPYEVYPSYDFVPIAEKLQLDYF